MRRIVPFRDTILGLIAGVTVGVLLLICVAVNITAVQSINRMSKPETLLEKKTKIADRDSQAARDEVEKWAMNKGYIPDELFYFYGSVDGTPTKCATWRNNQDNTILALYFAQRRSFLGNVKNIIVYDFVIIYADDKSLTTSNGEDATILPNAPGQYSV
jgi:hypothetical protein